MKTILQFLIIAVFFGSCSRQNTTISISKSLITVGDTVQSLGDNIVVIYQDKQHNYWFGSRGQGVYRYDGKHILQFTKKHGLVSNEIWGIQEDKSGNIYFDTQDGVGKFDGQTFSILSVNNTSDATWKLEPDDLWFKGNWNVNGPYRFDGKNLYHLAFPKNELADQLLADFPNMTWSPYGIYALYKDKKGNIWFGTSNLGIYQFDGKSVRRMYEKHLTEIAETGGSFGIRSIMEDKTGKFWFCNTRYRYNILPADSTEKSKTFIRYTRENGIDHLKTTDGSNTIYFLSVVEDNNGSLWMATYDQGVWQYDGTLTTHYRVKNGAKDIKMFSIYKDIDGALWLATQEAGAFKFDGIKFEQFQPLH